ncbi:MAG: ATP-binding cassette domain-containing protein [Alphaproteobacteria bacterium]|nr:ATP-binding cassette domain-containing protein [Alphaproteobacteria bacterium]
MRKSERNFISVENLTLGYGGNVVVENLNFNINAGDIFVIMGLSGCGKSTIMRSIVGLNKPILGRVIVGDQDLWAMSERAREKIIETFGVSYQSGALFSSMTFGENVALPMEMKTNMSRKEINKEVHKKLQLVGLSGYENVYPADASGGMIKRAALARALALNPRALFFDEPSAGLDPVRSRQLDNLIVEINKKLGTTIVMVTHELASIMSIATNSVYIGNKTVLATGAPKKILQTTKNKEIIEFLTRETKGGKK